MRSLSLQKRRYNTPGGGVNAGVRGRAGSRAFACSRGARRPNPPRLDTRGGAPYTLGFALVVGFATVGRRESFADQICSDGVELRDA